MPYVEGQTIHDADSHVMELPGTINRYLPAALRAEFAEKTGRGDESPHWSTKAQAQHEDVQFSDSGNMAGHQNPGHHRHHIPAPRRSEVPRGQDREHPRLGEASPTAGFVRSSCGHKVLPRSVCAEREDRPHIPRPARR